MFFILFTRLIWVISREGTQLEIPDDIPLARSKSIIRPTLEELEYLARKEKRLTGFHSLFSPYEKNSNIWYEKNLIFQFESVLDFNAFWEFFVGIQFYRYDIQETIKQKKLVLLPFFEKRPLEVILQDELQDIYRKALHSMAQHHQEALSQVLEKDVLLVFDESLSFYGEDRMSALDPYRHFGNYNSTLKNIKLLLPLYFPLTVGDLDYYLFWRYCKDRTVRYGKLASDLLGVRSDLCFIGC
jgi:hypothetical protein